MSQRGGSQSAPRFRLIGSQTLRYQFLKNTTKAKINKCNYIKLKGFCAAKETLSKTKRQPTKLEKISENHKFDKRSISKIHKELMQLNSKKKKKSPVKNWAEDLNTPFAKDNIQMAKRQMKRCSDH